MKSMYNFLKRGSAGLMAYATLDGYRRAVINDNKARETDRILQDTSRKYELAIKEIEAKQDLISFDRTEIVASVGRIKENLDLINQDAKNLTTQISTSNNQGIDTSSKVINKSAKGTIDEINKLMDKINSKSSPNGNFLDSIFNIFDSYNTVQLGAIGHILACIFIFGCLSDIFIAFYGDYLINYLKLEEKYPWLVKWIRLRRKFLHYYIGLNIFLITITLLFIIYVNWIVLQEGG